MDTPCCWFVGVDLTLFDCGAILIFVDPPITCNRWLMVWSRANFDDPLVAVVVGCDVKWLLLVWNTNSKYLPSASLNLFFTSMNCQTIMESLTSYAANSTNNDWYPWGYRRPKQPLFSSGESSATCQRKQLQSRSRGDSPIRSVDSYHPVACDG